MQFLVVYSFDAVIDGIYYNFWGNEARVTYAYNTSLYLDKYDSPYSGAITIPEYVSKSGRTYKVTKIDIHAFDGCRTLESITIPQTVNFIDAFAFNKCSGLKSVNIPESVTDIGYGAFRGCTGLHSVTLHDNVINIGPYAFAYCSGLTSFNLPNSVTRIGENNA